MKRWVRWFLAISTGILSALPWLGFPGWVLFAAWLPLLALEHFLVRNAKEYKSIVFFGYAFLAFFIWNISTTWWIVHATAVGAALAILANSLLMSVTVWLAHLIRRNSVGAMGYLAWVVLWLTFEFFHFHWDIEWPWLTLGNGFANNIKLVQWYEFTGVLGGSLWVLAVNIGLFKFLQNFLKDCKLRLEIRTLAITVLLIVIPVMVSLIMYYNYKEEGVERKMLIVQPNIDPYSETHDEGALNDKLVKFIRLTKSALSDDINYIIGPETIFEQQWDERHFTDYEAVNQLRQFTQTGSKPAMIFGASTYQIYTDKEKMPFSARVSRDGAYGFDVYNSAIYVDDSGEFQVYHKSILVSGVEKMPFRKYLRFLDEIIIDLGGTTGTLGVQPFPTNFKAANGELLAPVICYESVFGGYLAQFVRSGAQAIIIITNDGWWKNTPGYKQHFSFARLRAIETRRYVARSANTGISGVINQRGDVVMQTGWWEEAAVKEGIRLNDKLTFYAVYGDYIGRLSMFVSALLILYLLSVVLRRDKKIRTNSIV